MAFCLGRSCLNPRTDLGFFQSIYLYRRTGLFLMTCKRTVQILPSSFLFPNIIYHCNAMQHQEKEKLIKKRPGEAHVKKLVIGPRYWFRLKTYRVRRQ